MRNWLLVLLIVVACGPARADQEMRRHTVSQGETMYSITQQYGIQEADLLQLNPDLKSGLRAGTVLIIPNGASTQSEIVGYEEHKVRRKETLFSLSRKYDVSVLDIKNANKELYSEPLRKGKRIKIPIFKKAGELVVDDPAVNPGDNSGGATDIDFLPGDNDVEVPRMDDEDVAQAQEVRDRDTQLPLADGQYRVKRMDTRYSLSRKHNISIEELEALNGGSLTLRTGDVINVPRTAVPAGMPEASEDLLDKGPYMGYKVKAQETLYSIAKRTGLSLDSLTKLNPFLKDGLKDGQVLRLPNPDYVKGEANMEVVPGMGRTIEFNEAFGDLRDSIVDRSEKRLAILLPFSLQKITETSTEKDRLKKDKALRIALDFYSGSQMAIDSAKSLGIPVRADVYDTQNSSSQLRSIMANNDMEQYQVIIGPLFAKNVDQVARELRGDRIAVVSPLTSSDVELYRNVFQARPDDMLLENHLMDYLQRTRTDEHVFLIADSKNTRVNDRIKRLFPEVKVITVREGNYVRQDDVVSQMVAGAKNWVILATDDVGLISSSLSYLNSQADTKDITVFTPNRGKGYDNTSVNNMHLGALNFTYPSVDGMSTDRTMMRSYRDRYGITPNQFAVRGFDVTMDVILRLAAAGDMFESARRNGTTQYVESRFDYDKKLLGGYFNEACFLLQMNDKLEIKVLQ